MQVASAATPARPAAGQTVAFAVTLSNDARAIRGAAISFGDGRVLQLGATARATVTYTYAAAGAYSVTVTATDVAGYTAASSIAVEVEPAPAIAVTLTASPDAPVEKQPVTFTVEVTAPADAPAVRDVTIDFGDKSRKKSMGALTGRGSVAHVYSNLTILATRKTRGGTRASAQVPTRSAAAADAAGPGAAAAPASCRWKTCNGCSTPPREDPRGSRPDRRCPT